MMLGLAGKTLIQSFESLKLEAYQDQRVIWTIGWGHTPAAEGDTCTPEQADAWFTADVSWACRAIMDLVDIALNQNQFDALVSFVFNVGRGSFAGSTLLKLLNARDIPGAAAQILEWDHTNGVVNLGLVRRRRAEQALFLTQ
jgi:lysozyme